MLPAGGVQTDSRVLELAAIAEQWSEHPLARAIVEHAKNKGLQSKDVDDFQATPGMGIDAFYEGTKIKVGSPGFISSANVEGVDSAADLVDKLQLEGKTVVLVSINGKLAGVIALLDSPKPGAKETIASLRSLGIEPVMLTGDNQRTADAVARQVGIERVFAGVLPSGKVDVVKAIQHEGKKVAMIGDGINDAPALTAADVGIAIGSGTDLAVEAGGVVLVREDIRDVVSAVQIAKKIVSKIRQNLAYAFMYNVVLIPVAAIGMLYPALAGLAMAASSVSVTASSLDLKRWSPPRLP
jgi:Cu+-exporting ATPase